jgi:hypothetical protein
VIIAVNSAASEFTAVLNMYFRSIISRAENIGFTDSNPPINRYNSLLVNRNIKHIERRFADFVCYSE